MSEGINDKIIQVSGFGVNNTQQTQCDFMVVALTESGKVLFCNGYKDWWDATPELKKYECETAETLQAKLDANAEELAALRGFANEVRKVYFEENIDAFAGKYKLIDELGNPKPILTGVKE